MTKSKSVADDAVDEIDAPVMRESSPYAPVHDAPFVYFDHVSSYGIHDGVAQITLEARRFRCEEGTTVITDRVMVAHLRCSLAALGLLRSTIDSAILLSQPVPEGRSN